MRKASRLFVYLCLPCLLLGLELVAAAGHPGSFSGHYRITQTTTLPDNMIKVRFEMRVINGSGVDVKDASVTLSSTLRRNRPARPGNQPDSDHHPAPALQRAQNLPAHRSHLHRSDRRVRALVAERQRRTQLHHFVRGRFGCTAAREGRSLTGPLER